MLKRLLLTGSIALMAAACAISQHKQQPAPNWSIIYDSDWAAACACWKFTPKSRPNTIQRTDCIKSRTGYWHFATPLSPTGFATGIFYPKEYRVEWCDIRALRHEFSHAVHYKMTGDPGENQSGKCWL